MGNELEDISRG